MPAPTPSAALDAGQRADTAVQFWGREVSYEFSVATLAAVPVIRLATLGESIDTAVTTAIVFAGAGWHLWHHVPAVSPTRMQTLAAGVALGIGAWQLAWIDVGSFWFVQLALVLWALAWTGLSGGVVRGWRVVAAISIWAWWIGARPSSLVVGFGNWVAERTAMIAGWLLWQSGRNLSVHGAMVEMAHGRIEVGAPCTGLPLAGLLLVLLTIAALLMRLRQAALVRVATVVIIGSFLVGVARVTLLLLVADRPATFQYWHGARGSSWFCAIGIVLLAWLLECERRRTSQSVPPMVVPNRPRAGQVAMWTIATIAAASACAAALSNRPRGFTPPVAPMIASLQLRRSELTTLVPQGEGLTDRFEPMRRASYTAPDAGVEVETALAIAPMIFTGNAHTLGVNQGLLPSTAWELHALPNGDEVWLREGDGEVELVTLITAEGQAIARHEHWVHYYRSAARDSTRWIGWLAHRRPLPDRAAAWVSIHAKGHANATRTNALLWSAYESCRQDAIHTLTLSKSRIQ